MLAEGPGTLQEKGRGTVASGAQAVLATTSHLGQEASLACLLASRKGVSRMVAGPERLLTAATSPPPFMDHPQPNPRIPREK